MNIRVDLQEPIYDGKEVLFRSPVDCSQITGLILYYPENGIITSREFAFTDAHGHDVGDIDHLFSEDVVVKVIIDLIASKAFVQNADTNAYLEGRFADLEEAIGSGGGGGGGADLTNYVKKTDYASFDRAGVVKVSNFVSGLQIDDAGNLSTSPANEYAIDTRQTTRAITPTTVDYAVKAVLSNCQVAWTEEEKAAARTLLGIIDGDEVLY